jgi:DNA replication and repair protein RecF
LAVTYAAKGIPAADASTGEQKALLIGLILAHAGLLADMSGCAPVLLLDEVVAHLDPGRRGALFEEVSRLAGQVWLTGADPAAFAGIGSDAAIFEVVAGQVQQRRVQP